MKIAHFSDLHICAAYRKDTIQCTRDTLDYVLKEGWDHIVITGDLSHMGSTRDFEILRTIFEDYNLLDPIHGHVHEHRQYEKHGVVFVNGAGWSTSKRHHTLEVNIIRTEGQAFEIQRHRFPYSREKTVVPSGLA